MMPVVGPPLPSTLLPPSPKHPPALLPPPSFLHCTAALSLRARNAHCPALPPSSTLNASTSPGNDVASPPTYLLAPVNNRRSPCLPPLNLEPHRHAMQ
jgi:hypothetical protein